MFLLILHRRNSQSPYKVVDMELQTHTNVMEEPIFLEDDHN